MQHHGNLENIITIWKVGKRPARKEGNLSYVIWGNYRFSDELLWFIARYPPKYSYLYVPPKPHVLISGLLGKGLDHGHVILISRLVHWSTHEFIAKCDIGNKAGLERCVTGDWPERVSLPPLAADCFPPPCHKHLFAMLPCLGQQGVETASYGPLQIVTQN